MKILTMGSPYRSITLGILGGCKGPGVAAPVPDGADRTTSTYRPVFGWLAGANVHAQRPLVVIGKRFLQGAVEACAVSVHYLHGST